MPTIQQKRRLTYVTIGAFFLLGGIEYAVILPTIWLYLSDRFNASSNFLGLVLSAFSVADMIASPLIGRWSDRTGNSRAIVLVANVPQFIGSVMYFLGFSPWFLVASRFVVGLGSGASAALLADVARVTSKEQRTTAFSILMSCRQLGLLIGPGCNLFLMHIDFYIGPFKVDSYSVPGLFMAVLWVVHQLMTLFLFWNLTSLRLQEQIEHLTTLRSSFSEHPYANTDTVRSETTLPLPSGTSPDPGGDLGVSFEPSSDAEQPLSHRLSLQDSDVSTVLTSSNEYMEVAEQYMGCSGGGGQPRRHRSVPSFDQPSMLARRTSQRPSSAEPFRTASHDYGAISPGHESLHRLSEGAGERSTVDGIPSHDGRLLPPRTDGVRLTSSGHSMSYYAEEFLRDEVIAILATVFIAFFNQVSFETMVTPLTYKFLHWVELENSLLYLGAGVEVVFVFIVIMRINRHLQDRTMLLFGFVLETLVIALFLWFLPQAKENDNRKNMPVMLAGIFVDLIGLPLLVVTSTSLYSKITREETQGFAQGIRRVFAQFGTILGPLWAGSMIDRPYWMFGVMLGVNLFSTCLLLFSFDRLKESNSVRLVVNSKSEETEPLLRR